MALRLLDQYSAPQQLTSAGSAMATHVETPQEYTKRLLGYIAGKDSRAILETTPRRLREIVSTTPGELLRRKPAPGKWSIGELMAHLADAEVVGSWRMRLVLANNGSPMQAYDQEAWASNFRYELAEPADSVEAFTAARMANLRLLDRVDPKLHENYGMHAERGRETVTRIADLYAGHDLNHLMQIERILAANGTD
jgi:hypothetical protein